MTIYTFTAEQARVAISQWNGLANEDHQLTADQVHLILGDNFDDEMAEAGCAQIEVGSRESKTGNPATFYIMAKDVTAEEVEAE